MKDYYPYPKRDAVKNYFPMPNEIFALGLEGGEILVYTYLMCREDRKTFKCYPSYKTIGEAVGMSKNTVKKICGRSGGETVDRNRTDTDHCEKRTQAQRQFALYDPPHRRSYAVSLRETTAQSRGRTGTVETSFCTGKVRSQAHKNSSLILRPKVLQEKA